MKAAEKEALWAVCPAATERTPVCGGAECTEGFGQGGGLLACPRARLKVLKRLELAFAHNGVI